MVSSRGEPELGFRVKVKVRLRVRLRLGLSLEPRRAWSAGRAGWGVLIRDGSGYPRGNPRDPLG